MEIQSTQYLDNFKQITSKGNIPGTTYIPNASSVDCVDFVGKLGANLQYNKEKSTITPTYEGNVNGKNAVMKIIDRHDMPYSYFEGSIGGKVFQMQTKDGHYFGSIGTKAFDLKVNAQKPSKIKNFFYHTLLGRTFIPDYFNISGQLDGKEFKLDLPNSKVPKDETEKDVMSMILFDDGLVPMTFGDNIVELDYSSLARNGLRKFREKREKRMQEDVKPLVMQSISAAASIVIGGLITTLMAKYGLRSR
jgi:hypothetical protein